MDRVGVKVGLSMLAIVNDRAELAQRIIDRLLVSVSIFLWGIFSCFLSVVRDREHILVLLLVLVPWGALDLEVTWREEG